LAFNFAVWKFRRPALAARVCQNSDWLSSRIFDLAVIILNKAKSFRKKRKDTKISSVSCSINIHDDLVLSYGKDVVFCYTDGSATPNPGPCGAAASLFFCNPDVLIDVGLSLGLGTNNIGELAALFVCFSELLKAHTTRLFSKAVIFCDSKYAIGLASSTKKPSSNFELVNLLRSVYRLASAAFHVSLHWVKGHSAVGGNHRVDCLSKFFASCEHKVSPGGPEQTLSTYAFHETVWEFSFPLNDFL
jgi:ribonuclease HI